MIRLARSILIATAFALALMSATTVFAESATWDQVDVTLHAEQTGGVLLVAGTLPEKTALPADAELSVPAGAKLQWIGEILGGPASADPELKYTKETKDGVDVYRFTLTKARTAQAEVIAPVTGFDGTTYTPAINWTSAQAIPTVRLSIRVPQGAQLAETPPGVTAQPANDGFTFYSKSAEKVKPGDELGLTFAYTVPAGAAPAAGAATATNSDGPVLAVILGAIAVIAIAVVLVSRRNTAPVSSVDDEPETGRADDRSSDADEDAPVGPKPGTAKRRLVTALVIGAFILGVVVVGGQSTKPKMTGDTVSQTFAQGEACTTASIALVAQEGANAAETAETAFKALSTVSGLKTATFSAKANSVQVGFCDSETSEQAIRAALAPTGLIAQ